MGSKPWLWSVLSLVVHCVFYSRGLDSVSSRKWSRIKWGYKRGGETSAKCATASWSRFIALIRACGTRPKMSFRNIYNPSFPKTKTNSLRQPQPIKSQQTAQLQWGHKALAFDCLCSRFSLSVAAASLVVLVAHKLRYFLRIPIGLLSFDAIHTCICSWWDRQCDGIGENRSLEPPWWDCGWFDLTAIGQKVFTEHCRRHDTLVFFSPSKSKASATGAATITPQSRRCSFWSAPLLHSFESPWTCCVSAPLFAPLQVKLSASNTRISMVGVPIFPFHGGEVHGIGAESLLRQ